MRYDHGYMSERQVGAWEHLRFINSGTRERNRSILEARRGGMAVKEIAKRFGLSHGRISKICEDTERRERRWAMEAIS